MYHQATTHFPPVMDQIPIHYPQGGFANNYPQVIPIQPYVQPIPPPPGFYGNHGGCVNPFGGHFQGNYMGYAPPIHYQHYNMTRNAYQYVHVPPTMGHGNWGQFNGNIPIWNASSSQTYQQRGNSDMDIPSRPPVNVASNKNVSGIANKDAGCQQVNQQRSDADIHVANDPCEYNPSDQAYQHYKNYYGIWKNSDGSVPDNWVMLPPIPIFPIKTQGATISSPNSEVYADWSNHNSANSKHENENVNGGQANKHNSENFTWDDHNNGWMTKLVNETCRAHQDYFNETVPTEVWHSTQTSPEESMNMAMDALGSPSNGFQMVLPSKELF